MATAAQRFFAIPELLEQVLLELGGYADPLENPSNIIDLFALHRVNRSFAATIRNSQKLRWRMGLRDQLPRAQYHGSIENIALTCLRRGIFVMPPYEFMHTTRPYPSPSRPKHLLLAFQVSADYFAEEYLGSLGYFGGLRGKNGRIYCKPRQSWRQMRLTTDPIPIVVQINVYCPHKELRGSPLSGPFCTEWVSFRPSEVTLGNLADFFEAVGRKKREGRAGARAIRRCSLGKCGQEAETVLELQLEESGLGFVGMWFSLGAVCCGQVALDVSESESRGVAVGIGRDCVRVGVSQDLGEGDRAG